MDKRTVERLERMAFSAHELADAAGVSVSAIYDSIRAGELVSRKWGRRTVILRADAEAFLNGLPKGLGIYGRGGILPAA